MLATARKLTAVIWHMLSKGEEYIWNRPALLDWKMRKLEWMCGKLSEKSEAPTYWAHLSCDLSKQPKT